MIHNLYILLGINAEQNISRIKEYAIKYGDEYVDENGNKASDYLQLLLYGDNGQFYFAREKKRNDSIFVSGIEDSYAVDLVNDDIVIQDGSFNALRGFFNKLFTSTVNMQRHGDGSLRVCIHIPLIDPSAWERAQQLIAAMRATNADYKVDILASAADLAHIYIDDPREIAEKVNEHEECAKMVLNDIVTKKQGGELGILENVILISNVNESGIALNLTRDSFASLIGEYALATTSIYSQIYTPAFAIATTDQRPIIGLGMSMIHFDRFHFVQYMLHRAYTHILNREGINQNEVDVNKVAPIVRTILKDNINIFSKLYDTEVRDMLAQNMSDEDIMSRMQSIIDAEIERLQGEFLSFFSDDNLTLPEKRAALAQLMGEDDELLTGVLYDGEKQLIVEDCRQEVLDMFIDANNALSGTYKEPDDDEEETEEDPDPLWAYAALSKLNGEQVVKARTRLDEKKKKLAEIKSATNYIRQKSIEVEQLGDNMAIADESKKRLTKDGFEFEGQTYHLMPENIERPLEETFVPQPGKLPSEIDLRQQFTPIKDQGAFGSCAAFTMVSIYEYILKKNDNKDIDLSELFAYHNARKRMEDDDIPEQGTSLYHMVKGMGEDGICLEKFHPYKEADDVEPSAEAYEDAQTRKISKALNVECNIDHIKAAVAQGYPVAISLRIFESFATSTGIVPHPSEEEINSPDDGSHAMVVCGYSDSDRLFIVRNSWGVRFGDKGYCYIPYSYMGNEQLMRNACIITDISLEKIVVHGKAPQVAISFNKSDAQVQVALLKAKIGEKQHDQKRATAELADIQADISELAVNLGDPRVRERIIDGEEKRLDREIEALEEKRHILTEQRSQARDDFNDGTRRMWIGAGVVALGLFIIYTVLLVWLDYPTDHEYLLSWGILNTFQAGGIIALCAAFFINARSSFYLHGEYYDKYVRKQNRMWGVWFFALFATIATYVMLFMYQVIDSIFPLGVTSYLWLMVLSYVPFIYYMMARIGVGRMIEHDYDIKLEELNKELVTIKNERDHTKLKMHIAGRIIDNMTKLITGMTRKNFCVYSYVNNLKVWYKENSEISPKEPVCRLPFMSLTNNKCLDNYFNQYADQLTDGISLQSLFLNGNYNVTESEVIAFKNKLKLQLESELWRKVSDFSIYDHVSGARKFDYVSHEHVDLDRLLQEMDNNSEIFVRTHNHINNAATMNVMLKLLFREAPDNNSTQTWNSAIGQNFTKQPTAHDLSSRYKIFIIRLEGLAVNEVSILQ